MEIEIKLGKYELIYSISVIQIENLPIQIKLPDTFGEQYVITFQFITDPLNKPPITRTTVKDKQNLIIDFVNFFDPDQIGNIKLMEVGSLRELPLFLNYRVTPLRGSTRMVLFNFYIRKEA
jgi:hypothetical protein